jgi:hypothetical protein
MMLFCEKCGHQKLEIALFSSLDWECSNGNCGKQVQPVAKNKAGTWFSFQEYEGTFPVKVSHILTIDCWNTVYTIYSYNPINKTVVIEGPAGRVDDFPVDADRVWKLAGDNK